MIPQSRNTGTAIAIGASLTLMLPAIAQEAVIKSQDGTTEMSVTVLGFDDGSIRVSSNVGEFTFDRDNVVCEGPGCPPSPEEATSPVGIGDTVTLTDASGLVRITGQLVSFSGTHFVLATAQDEFTLPADGVTCEGAGCPTTQATQSAPSAAAVQTAAAIDLDDEATVTLRTNVGAVEITGTLLEYTGDAYVVLTPTGEFRMKSALVSCEGNGCPDPSAVPVAPVVQVAQEQTPVAPPRPAPDVPATVTLTTKVGAIDITGTLVDFNGTEYVVLTPTGEYRMRTDRVTCSGAACPEGGEAQVETVAVAASQPSAAVAAAAETTAAPDLASAPEVTLTTNVGAIEISGKLLDYTGTEYVVFTPTGEYRLQATTVSCSGVGCPEAVVQPAVLAAAVPDTPAETVAFDPQSADLRFAGADAVGVGLIPSLWKGYADWRGLDHELLQLPDNASAGRFMDTSGDVQETHYVEITPSTQPFAALINNTAEFSLAARAPNEQEAGVLRAVGAGSLTDPENNVVVAVESVAMIVHPDNPVGALSLDQIAQIYRGEITNWAQVGGTNDTIVVLSRDDDSGTREVFQQSIARGGVLRESSFVRYPGNGNAGMREAVLADPNAIGYVAFASAQGAKRLNLASSCGLTFAATPFSIKTEEYPLVRRHYLFARADGRTPAAQSFIDFMRSPASEGAVAASDLVNFALEVQPDSVASGRLEAVQQVTYNRRERGLARALMDDLQSWDRLSTTLRFATGSSQLGTREIDDIKRLIAFLEQQPEGTEVAIVGFADSIGEFAGNLRLSNARAALVAREIDAQGGRELRGVRFTTKAYSELAPAACNTEETGRQINRRVEIWMRQP